MEKTLSSFDALSNCWQILRALFWRRICYCLVVCLSSQPLSADERDSPTAPLAKQVAFDHLPKRELASLSNINAIVQDKNGFMWFGGSNGLARYDGYRIQIFNHKNNDRFSISDNKILDMQLDQQGTLWLATNRGLNRYDYQTGHFINPIEDEDATMFSDEKRSWLESPNCLLTDKKGGVWIGTLKSGLLYYHPATKTLKRFPVNASLYNNDGEPSEIGNHVSSLEDVIHTLSFDSQGHIWLGLNNLGLAEFNPDTEKIQYYFAENSPITKEWQNPVLSLWFENDETLWVGTYGAGLRFFNPQSEKYFSTNPKHYEYSKLVGNYVREIFSTRAQDLWIATDSLAAFRIQLTEQQFIRYDFDNESINSFSGSRIGAIFEDQSGDIWFGLDPAAVDVIHRNTPYFTNYSHNPYNPDSLADNSVLSVIEAQDRSLWVGTEMGLTRFDGTTGKAQQFTKSINDRTNPNGLPASAVLALLNDSRGDIWVSTWSGGLSRYQTARGEFTHYFSDQGNNSISDDRIWKIYEDSDHIIWLGNERSGLSSYNPSTQQFTHYRNDPQNWKSIQAARVQAIFEDSKKQLWIGTAGGLDLFDRASGEFTHYKPQRENKTQVDYVFITFLFEGSKNTLWLGTYGEGLFEFDPSTQAFKNFSTEHGLADNSTTGIQEDDFGILWVSTNNGLSRFDPKTQKFKNFNQSHGLPGNLFKREANTKRRNGNLVFGTTTGLTEFNPQDIQENRNLPQVVFTSLSLFNQIVLPDSENSPLQSLITETNKITLNHEQSVFTLEFAGLNYRFANDNQYAYQLQGFDKSWNYVGDKRTASYTNLDPGDYVFKVKAANNDGYWNERSTNLAITILPAPWRSWWAYTLYSVSFLLIMFYLLRQERKKLFKARQNAAMERAVSERLRNLDKLKENFLANTSHELRTPLNGIIGLAESINEHYSDLPGELKEKIKVILFSGKRLANIVDDILEFSQLANNKLVLQLSAVELRPVVESVVLELSDRIRDKSLTLLDNIPEHVHVLSNLQKLSQIIHHFLDNAIKFTREGTITLEYHREEDFDCISISDTGIGISSENMSNIFNSFQQAEGSAARSQDGAGLGLSIIQKLVGLHQGNIQVESTLGQGTTFKIRLPKLHQAAEISDIKTVIVSTPAPSVDTDTPDPSPTSDAIQTQQLLNIYFYSHLYLNEALIPVPTTVSKPYKVLVVDDDPVNRMVVKAHLRKHNYASIEAIDGQDALKMMNEHNDIDLIVLDVMMPYMTGYEVCEILRKDHPLHQLPIIFLTANHQPEEIKKGFIAGGSDFLTKPIAGKRLNDKLITHFALLEQTRYPDTLSQEQRSELLSVVQASVRILEHISQLINGISCSGCWIKVDGNKLEPLNFNQTNFHETRAISLNEVKTILKENVNEDSLVALNTKELIKSGGLGRALEQAECLLSEPLMQGNKLYGFILLGSSADDFIAPENKKILRRLKSHIEAAIAKVH